MFLFLLTVLNVHKTALSFADIVNVYRGYSKLNAFCADSPLLLLPKTNILAIKRQTGGFYQDIIGKYTSHHFI